MASWIVHPNLVKNKPQTWPCSKKLAAKTCSLGRKKIGSIPPFCAWDFMGGIRTVWTGGTETTGWHPLLSHWESTARLRSLFNSGSPKFHASVVFGLEARDLRQRKTHTVLSLVTGFFCVFFAKKNQDFLSKVRELTGADLKLLFQQAGSPRN